MTPFGQFDDGLDGLCALLVIGFAGHAILQTSGALKVREKQIFSAAVVLAVSTGIIAGIGFVASERSPDGDSVIGGIMSGGFVGLMSLLGWYFAGALVAFSWHFVLRWPFVGISRMRKVRRQRRENRRRLLQQKRDSESRALINQQTQQQEAALKKQRASAQQQREDIRLQCELFYDRHAPALREAFAKERLEQYFEQYFGDNHDPEVVQNRAERLIAVLESHLESAASSVDERQTFRSLQEIADHFEAKRQEAQALERDTEVIESMVTSINRQEDAAIEKFLQS